MAELYIFSQDDKLLTIITEDTGLVSAPIRIEVNSVPDTPFSFTVEADAENTKYVKEENKAVYRDHEGDLRLVVIRELDDSDSMEGPLTTATCEPEFMELAETFVLDRRFTDRTAQFALDAALEQTGWIGEVEVELGLASTNFYRLRVIDAIFDIIKTWGGEFKDVVEFDEENNIVARKVKIIQRLGADTGQRFEIDHNITEIGRTVLSYPVTAMYGWGASLETEGGGHTRYIDFADVEWKKGVNRAPVDKPKGQKWVGDPEAFERYKRYRGGKWVHRYGEFSNQDYEDPEELLWATWQNLQENKQPEVNYRLSVDLFDDKVSLGDTAIAIDRYFSRPIEIQTRIIAMEYDLLDIDGTMVVEMGQFLDLGDDRLDKLEEKVDKVASRPQKVTENSYPDRKPSTPVNLEAYGGFETIQLYWDYADEIFIKHYEVYGSQVADFVPDEQHLLWRGQVSAFGHAVNTDETWYYYVRAVNYHGTASDWSVKVSASTVRIISEDILWGPELAERMRELHQVSDIIGENGINFDQISQEAKELINQQARIYTDEEIRSTREDLMRDISDISDNLEYIDGQLVDKVNVGDVYEKIEIDNKFDNVVSITQYETDMEGLVKNLEHQESLIKQNEKEILNRVSETVFNEESDYLRKSIAETRTFAEGIEQTVSSIEIGGRNLATIDSVKKWGSGTLSRDGHKYTLSNSNGNSNVGLSIDRSQFKNNTEYVVSFKVKKISGTINTMAGHRNAQTSYEKVYKDGTLLEGATWNTGDTNYNNSSEVHEYVIYFKTSTDAVENSNQPFYIQPNRPSYGETFVVEIWDLQLEEGNKKTGYRPAYEDTDRRMTYSESRITQLSKDITLKVDVDNIVSEINLNREGIRLSSELIHLSGLSLIEDAIIENVHIKNGTIERSKLVRAIIGEAQIEDLAVTSAKIASVNADRINAGAIRGIDVYGAKFRSSSGTDWMEIVGGNMHLDQANGRYVNVNPDGLFGYNASGSLRFQANSTLVTSSAFGTSNANVYLAAQANNEARVVDYRDIPGDGLINSYRYLPLRASGFYGNFWNINPAITATNLYARPLSGGELRATLNGTTDVYMPIRASVAKANVFEVNSLSGSSDHVYVKSRSNGELRATVSGTTDNYIAVRGSGFYGSFIDRGTAAGVHLYARPAGGGELQVTVRGTTSTYRPVRALDYLPPNSTRESKKYIEVFADNTLDTFRSANVYHYLYKWQENDEKLRLGVMLDEVPDDIVAPTGDTLELYSTVGFLWKGLKDTVNYLDDEINWQRVEYQILNNKVTKINNEIAQLRKEHKEMKEEIKELREMVA